MKPPDENESNEKKKPDDSTIIIFTSGGPMPTKDNVPPGFDVIFTYSRANALADGVLIDVTAWAAKEGFLLPAAMTATLYGEATRQPGGVPPPDGITIEPELAVRWLFRKLWMYIAAAKDQQHRKQTEIIELGSIRFYGHCGPGDKGEPVVTLMLEGED